MLRLTFAVLGVLVVAAVANAQADELTPLQDAPALLAPLSADNAPANNAPVENEPPELLPSPGNDAEPLPPPTAGVRSSPLPLDDLRPTLTPPSGNVPSERSLVGPRPLRLEEIDILFRAGVRATLIIELVRHRGLASNLSSYDLIWLRSRGVSNELIRGLQVTTNPDTIVPQSPGHQFSPDSSLPLQIPEGRMSLSTRVPLYAPKPPRPAHRFHRKIPLRRWRFGH